MSIGNRVKLCDALARKKILGKKFFNKIFPKITRLTITTPAWFRVIGGEINTEIHLGAEHAEDEEIFNDSKFKTIFDSPELYSGDTLTLQSVVGCYGHDHHVDFEFALSSGSVVYCQAHASQWTDENQNTDEFIRILMPLADGYYYTKAIAEHFDFPTSNQNVGIYPPCRNW